MRSDKGSGFIGTSKAGAHVVEVRGSLPLKTLSYSPWILFVSFEFSFLKFCFYLEYRMSLENCDSRLSDQKKARKSTNVSRTR